MQIHLERLLADIETYGKFGANQYGGITRPSFSKEDQEVRNRFIQELLDLGLTVTIDGAANIWGKWEGNGSKKGSIVIGSHLDSVPNGGKYDGPLGTLVAKEIVRTLIEDGIRLDHDLEIVSFTAEESNDFHLSTFGSRAFAGKLSAVELEHVIDSKGNHLKYELVKVGGDLERFPQMKELAKEKKAFIELHIEQGQRLEHQNISAAVIDKVVGMYRSKVTVTGETNHSGTTMMQHRRDALAAAAEMVLEVEFLCNKDETDIVGTVGRMQVFPNATNIVPGQVVFTFEIRGESTEKIDEMVRKIQEGWKGIAKRRQVQLQEDIFLKQAPITLDSEVVRILQKTAQEMSEPILTLASMAVHDAAQMATVTKSAMIFVKSIGGKSHCPAEYSVPKDIERAGNLMLKGILNLDRALI
ncbi:Zn-dependent hydrolase [Bacillus salipaludis]|uniref:Zn-dependent hydrolase n=1 Tax=Bacillus salipaludis TaxID=2547811 RepID=A0AA90QY40_9BACI|nr:Zn-dependent hydrolase [Bacillus salipaludis]MDQ6597232.1 Zn-dependent hydrolase [Bacillus salipaludis]